MYWLHGAHINARNLQNATYRNTSLLNMLVCLVQAVINRDVSYLNIAITGHSMTDRIAGKAIPRLEFCLSTLPLQTLHQQNGVVPSGPPRPSDGVTGQTITLRLTASRRNTPGLDGLTKLGRQNSLRR